MACTTSGQFVGTYTCPALDPKIGKLVSIDATLQGRVDIEMNATSKDVGPKTITVNVDHTIDLFGTSFYWPGVGSRTVALGPTQTKVQIQVVGASTKTYTDASTLARFNGKKDVSMVVSADPKAIQAPGVTVSGIQQKNRASFSLTYHYVPVSLAATAAGLPPIGPIRPGDLPAVKDLKPIPYKPAGSGVKPSP